MNLEVAIQGFIEQYGVLSIFIIVLLEYSNMPIPSEVVLPVVGVFVSTGTIDMVEATTVSLVAGVLGSLLNYYLGYYLGNPLIKKIVSVAPKLQKSVDASMWWIDKYGTLSVMISRVIPLVRTFISIPAGVVKMNLVKFMGYSSLGILIWNTSLIYLGYMCSSNMELIASVLMKYSVGIVLTTIIMVSIYCLLLKVCKIKKK